jgi:prepilin peptidase CpaA
VVCETRYGENKASDFGQPSDGIDFVEGALAASRRQPKGMSSLPPILQVSLVLLVVIAAYFDLRWRRIPNWLAFGGVLTGIGLNAFMNESAGLKASLLGLGLAFVVYLPLYTVRGVGGGDVKLMAAVGAVTGPRNWIAISLFTAITGGLAAVVLVALRGRMRTTLGNVLSILRSIGSLQAPYTANPALDVKDARAVTLPHGAMIALGVLEFLVAAAISPR